MLGNLHRDTIFQSVRGQGGPWVDVEVHDVCASTNTELARDPRPWRVVVADEQVSGRGRLDRSWSTPPGVALALSFSVPLPPRAELLAWLSPLTAMAVTDALREVTGVRCGWKWPNDVLGAREDGAPAAADGSEWGKLCGILGQVSTEGTLVMGAGVNLAQRHADLPVPAATSVRECGGVLDATTRARLVGAVCQGVARRHAELCGEGDGAARLAREYQAGCLTVGQEVRVSLPGGQELRGRAHGVDDDARLLVRHGDGETALSVGDVVHVRGAGGYAR